MKRRPNLEALRRLRSEPARVYQLPKGLNRLTAYRRAVQEDRGREHREFSYNPLTGRAVLT